MISSPCINCPNKSIPKDQCMHKCKTLQDLQDFQISHKEDIFSYAVDYSEETSISINTKGLL